ncbi:thioester reductase domain-containing protein [Actinomadura sp. 9N215]|uniref:thioester reductase domain-containing protein n=1 Tax=Actinomadura sp. 9N215 TaxID=3375150 RepID=UPI0037A38BEA
MEAQATYRTRLAEATATIQRLRDRLDGVERKATELERKATEPIAVVGMSLRMPGGAETPEEFWTLLRQGTDTTREFPAARGDARAFYDPDPDRPGSAYVIRGGFLDAVAGFDPAVFGIAPREAIGMDPQQRLMLEVTWEALERAGYAPTGLSDTRTGVYFGVSTTDYVRMRQQLGDIRDVDAYQLTGEPSFIAGRVSYVLGLRGPSTVIDTTCSSSLVAVHQASQALRGGECDMALAGGVNLMLSPYGFVLMSKFRALAADGRCKTFDASADGYARGEGAGVLVLKRLSDARADDDTVLAVVRGSAVNHDGRSSGLTVPNPLAQQDVIRRALEQGAVAPGEVGYVEAHGTGTSLGDPIELRALNAVMRPDGDAEPLLVGSVKTNIGHLEPAAGVAGLIKVILAIGHGEVPPHLNLVTPNPNIPWNRLNLEVPTSLRPWPDGDGPRTAGVSGFGASGTNAHVVLSAPDEPDAAEAADAANGSDAAASADRAPGGSVDVLLLSARTPQALRTLAERYADALRTSGHRLADICHTSRVGRARLGHGLAVTGRSRAEIAAELDRYARRDERTRVTEAEQAPYPARKLAWLFTGQGAQYRGMAAGLADEPAFAAAFERCRALFEPLLPVPLERALWAEDPGGADLDDTLYTQPALFATEYALGSALLAYGPRPAAMLGHSVGEISAACLAGVMDLPDAVRLVAHRARLMAALPAGGAMSAVNCDERTASEAIAASGTEVSVAAVNGPDEVVLSGDAAQVAEVCSRLAADGHRARSLKVSHAFHSALVRPMLDEFQDALEGITFRPPAVPLVSNVTGRFLTGEELGPEYWARHAAGTVRFHDGLRTLHAHGIRTFLETGPQPVLVGLGRRAVTDPACAWIGGLREGRDDRARFLRALGALSLRGCDVDWRALNADRRPRRVPGPTYPWEREHYWFRAAPPGAGGHPNAVPARPGLGARVRAAVPMFEEHVAADGPVAAPEDALGLLVERAVRAAAAGHGGRWRTISAAGVEPSLPQDARGPWLIQTTVRPGPADPADHADPADPARHAENPPGTGTAVSVEVTGIGADTAHAEAPWLAHGRVELSRSPRTASAGTAAPARTGGAGPPDAWPEAASAVPAAGEDEDEAAAWGAVVTAAVRATALVFGAWPGSAGWVGSLAAASCDAPGDVREARVTGTRNGGVADVVLLAGDGSPLGSIEGLRWAELPEPAPSRWYPEPEVLYGLEWRRAEPRPARRSDGERVLLIGSDPLTGRIGDELRGHGVPVELVPPDPDACAAAVDGLPAEGRARVVVSGFDLSAPEITADLLRDRLFGTEHLVVTLVRRLAARDADPPPRLTLLTRGAVDTGRQGAHHPAAAPLWGLGRVVALEHPELWGAALDLDPGLDDPEEQARIAARAILDRGGEDQCAFRGRDRFVPRLRPAPAGTLPAHAPGPLHRHGTVLITGGLGGIGLATAAWLAAAGTPRLVLASRSAPPDGDRWDDDGLPGRDRAAVEAIRRIRDLGAEVETARLDVTDAAAVAALVDRLAGGPAPLRGVIHAAGVSGPQDLVDVEADAYRRVWEPKTVGAWNLHERTRDLDLDMFVCFSSIAATWGSQHLASYAAGNMFLDALASYRHGLGLPALTVDWGPWGQRSHLFENDVMSFLESVGLRQLDPSQCLSLLGRMLRGDRPHHVVCAADWATYTSIMASRSERPVFAELDVTSAASGDAQDRELLDLLAGHSPATPDGSAARRRLLLDFLTAGVADVLGTGTDALTAGGDVFELGLDSLMVMEIATRCRRSLGVVLRPKEFFARSTLAEWAGHLDDVLRGESAETTGGRPEEAGDAPDGPAGQVSRGGPSSPTPSGDPYERPAAIAARVSLPEDVRPIGAPHGGPPRRVLLTGATGFVGAFLLDALLEHTDAEVECLVRCADEDDGPRRVRRGVETYLPWREDEAHRVHVLRGDLAKPGLGLGPGEFGELAERIDVIHHAGARVDFVHTYEQLAAANVGGTLELLRLAAAGRPKHLNHVSTYGIWGLPEDGRTRVLEDDDIAAAGRLVTGYVQTKWAAEHLVGRASGRGLPVRTFRLGRILGDSRTGACLTTHFTCRVIKGCVQLGRAPDLGDLEIEMTPVNYVARAMAHLSAGTAPHGVYHLVNPRRMRFDELIRHMRRRGWPVEVVDRREWWDALRRTYDVEANALHPVMDIVREFVVGGEDAIDYDVGRVTGALDGTGIVCPPLDERLLDTYFDYFVRSGYLAPGTGPRSRRIA